MKLYLLMFVLILNLTIVYSIDEVECGTAIEGGTGVLNTHSANTLRVGTIVVSAYLKYTHYEGITGRFTQTQQLIPLSITFGMTKNMELWGTIPFLFLTRKYEQLPNVTIEDYDESGLSDISIGGKYRILQESRGNPAVAVLAKLKLATGEYERELGSGTTDFMVTGAISKQYRKVNWYCNISYNIRGTRETETAGTKGDYKLGNQFYYNFALDYRHTRTVNLLLELYGIESAADEWEGLKVTDTDRSELYISPAARIKLHRKALLTTAVCFALGDENDRNYDWALILGVHSTL